MLAYLDAGTGSMIVGAVAAGAAGAGVAVKAGLAKLRRKPKGGATEDKQPAAETDPSEDPASGDPAATT